MSDINIVVAGQGGDGSLTVVTLLSRVLGQRGYHLYSARNVASRIKGGHAAAMLRGSTVRRGCMGDHIDLLFAFDSEAIRIAGPRVADEGMVIFDSSIGPVQDEHLAPGVRVIEIPFGRLAVRDLRRDLFKNSLGFGVVARLLSLEDGEAIDTLRHRFARQSDRVIDANVDALKSGFAFADELGLTALNGPWVLEQIERPSQLFITGNQALSLGFACAGGRFYAGYPITPATDILDWMTAHLHKFGGIVIQAEDELAAINMAIGAALTGARTMVATSSPGFSLMQEGLSQLGATEIPMVLVDVQRAGPSTGMPTKPEQSDLNMMVYGGNGDFPRIVLAPGDPGDAFEIATLATNLAQRTQGPVIIAMDQAIGQDASTTDPFDTKAVEVDQAKRLTATDVADLKEYRRYLVTSDGVSPWAVPGTPGAMNLVTGNEHNEWGQVSADPKNRLAMVGKRERKISSVHSALPLARRWGPGDASTGLLGVGMETGVIVEARERLEILGLPVDVLQPRTLWPVLDETLDFIRSKERVYVVEHSAEAQLARLLASAGAPHEKIRSITRYDGVPFTPGNIVDTMSAAMAGATH